MKKFGDENEFYQIPHADLFMKTDIKYVNNKNCNC